MQLALQRRTLRFRRPLRTGYGTLRERELIEVTLTADDGEQGRGEAAPLERYDGVSIERALAALRAYERVVTGAPAGAPLLDACREADALPQALAAIDLALWDLAGRRAAVTVCRLLAERPEDAVEVNASVAAGTPEQAAREAAAAVAAGYETVKLKVGLDRDRERVAAVRAAIGPRP